MQRIRERLTFANVAACFCLFVVLGGDSLAHDVSSAAVRLVTGADVEDRSLTRSDVARGSLTGAEIKNRSLTGADVRSGSLAGKQVRNRSLTAADIKKNSLTGAQIKNRSLTRADFRGSVTGPKGDQGPRGANGDPGAKGDQGPKGETGPAGEIDGLAARGDLTGTYPNPTIAGGKVDSAKIADGSIAPADLALPWALSGTFSDPLLSLTGGASGSGPLLKSLVDSTDGTRPAIHGEVNSRFANFGTAGVYGRASGTGGHAGLFYSSNPAGTGPGVIALTEGDGNGLIANAGGSGDGVETTADGNGNALYAWTPVFGTGRAARIANFNSSNTNPALTVESRSAGDVAVFKSGNPGTVNVARIDATGKGFFNGGTQVGGADLAEVVPTCGSVRVGQVVEIDPRKPDCFRVSTRANTTRVAGVVSTAPGVTLNAPKGATTEASAPALALAGRVPVKVTNAGGKIRIGDLLVASSKPGHAMRAPADPAVGSVIGKALEHLDERTGAVKMLVMSR